MGLGDQKPAVYDLIGQSYNVTRQADPRITQALIRSLALPAPARILDIGAGTGNYSVELARQGYDVIAVEPSRIMRETGKQHPNLTWAEGFAEQLPLEDNAVDGIISTLAMHHFSDLYQAFREMVRVTSATGRIVIFAADPRLCPDDSCWLKEYFRPVILQSYQAYQPIGNIVHTLQEAASHNVELVDFPVPHDITDSFFASAWRRPELYLDKEFRAGVSPLADCPDDMLQPLLERLETDLSSGAWDEQYGIIRTQDTYEGGYRFLVTSV
ncbi:class I SAM-dependent methyltransferase [Paenibacillus ihuae]|uniref:class I SAM-dependent methyltransferase n=1 Tax=Paenibacillus ihuae TaxID=1232431 RepID=UPI0006D5556B|nr:class I SAM-dependent methyltransferase [Paenibacillus ihuae]